MSVELNVLNSVVKICEESHAGRCGGNVMKVVAWKLMRVDGGDSWEAGRCGEGKFILGGVKVESCACRVMMR